MFNPLAKLWRLFGIAEKPAVFDTTHLDEVKFVVLDIETTGLAPADNILIIGAVQMIGPRILVGQTFEQFVQPVQTAWTNSVPVHRILPADVANAPPLKDILTPFAGFCRDAVLVGHQVQVDRSFLTRLNHPAAAQLAAQHWFDTRQTAHRSGISETSLAALARHYHIPITARHHALADAFVTAQIWQRQLAQLQAQGICTFSALAKVAQV